MGVLDFLLGLSHGCLGLFSHEAASCNFNLAIARLLALGADPRQIDSHGCTPEQLAEDCGFDESVAVFKAARAET